MGFLTSFLISLAISICLSILTAILFPANVQTGKASSPTPGELDGPTAEEGKAIPHMRGTRFLAPNCLYWTPAGTVEIWK